MGDIMTEKELLYYEDAIGHETNTIDICNHMVSIMNDKDLANFLKKQIKKHETIKEKLLNTMECEINGR